MSQIHSYPQKAEFYLIYSIIFIYEKMVIPYLINSKASSGIFPYNLKNTILKSGSVTVWVTSIFTPAKETNLVSVIAMGRKISSKF